MGEVFDCGLFRHFFACSELDAFKSIFVSFTYPNQALPFARELSALNHATYELRKQPTAWV